MSELVAGVASHGGMTTVGAAAAAAEVGAQCGDEDEVEIVDSSGDAATSPFLIVLGTKTVVEIGDCWRGGGCCRSGADGCSRGIASDCSMRSAAGSRSAATLVLSAAASASGCASSGLQLDVAAAVAAARSDGAKSGATAAIGGSFGIGLMSVGGCGCASSSPAPTDDEDDEDDTEAGDDLRRLTTVNALVDGIVARAEKRRLQTIGKRRLKASKTAICERARVRDSLQWTT